MRERERRGPGERKKKKVLTVKGKSERERRHERKGLVLFFAPSLTPVCRGWPEKAAHPSLANTGETHVPAAPSWIHHNTQYEILEQ